MNLTRITRMGRITKKAQQPQHAAHSMLEYVENENPQYFNCRYGYKDGRAFQDSFCQLHDLMGWAIEKSCQVEAEARYEYTDPGTGEHRILRVPEEVEQW